MRLISFVAACVLAVLAGPLRAADAPPQPGFDCKAARSTAEQLICTSAALARLDAQVADLYAQARASAAEPQQLRTEQLAWLRQRDTQCIAGAAFAEVRQNAQVQACLEDVYGARIAELRERVAAPLLPSDLVAVSGTALRQIGLVQTGCRAMQGLFNGDGDVLAVEVDCEAAGQGRRVWLIARGERAVPATPELGAGDPHGEHVATTGTELFWDGDTLYVFTSKQVRKPRAGEEPYWKPAYFTATLRNGATPIGAVPERVKMFFDMRAGSFRGDDPQALIDDADRLPDGAWLLGLRSTPGRVDKDGTAHFRQRGTRVVWLRDRGQNQLALMVKNFEQRGAVSEIARGGQELMSLRFDHWHLVYPGPQGLLLTDLNTQRTQRIAGTVAGDVPLAWSGPQPGQLAWISRQPCGGAKGAAGAYLCIAHLGGVKMPWDK